MSGPRLQSSVSVIPVIGGQRYGYTYDNLLLSRGNPRGRDGVRRGGGLFHVTHEQVSGDTGYWPAFSHLGLTSQAGPVAHQMMPTSPPAGPVYVTDPTAELSRLSPLGATGWKRARPGNPTAAAGQTVIETLLRRPTDPRTLMRAMHDFQSLNSRLRNLGQQHLNNQFGWGSLLRDMRNMYNTSVAMDRALKDLRRNNGRSVKRRRTLKNTTSTTSTSSTGLVDTLASFTSTPQYWTGWINWADPHIQTTTTEEIRQWFVGSWRSYTPDIGSLRWTRRATEALMGASPTPSLVWEVTPWSWLIDYFANFGDVYSNISANAVENQVADYAFVMESHKTTITKTASIAYSFNGVSGFNQVSYSLITEKKTRLGASPFGFGITYDGLSPYQYGILAALGASRSRF